VRFRLVHAEARRRALEAIRTAPDGYAVTLTPDKRTLDQNAKLHAILQELDGAEWAGKPRSAAEWKVLIVSGHTKATGGAVEIVPGLEGEFVNIRESTAQMDRQRASSLIEYAQAWLAMRG
jgi:hypothetical protein